MMKIRTLRKAALLAPLLLTSAGLSYGVILLLRTPSEASAQVGSNTPPAISPLYRSSVVGTDFDFITENDPSVFDRLEYVGFIEFEMPDKRESSGPLLRHAYVFEAYFTDGTRVRIALDEDFGNRQAAEQDAMRYAPRLGRLPSIYRQNLRHIVVHRGGADTTAFAEDRGHFFVVYSDNATRRITTHDLEETFFHEGTHATIQVSHLEGSAWRAARARDNAFVTEYARTNDQEDFAESALFAYTLIYHPERFPAAERARIERQIPNRIAFFRTLFTDERALPTSTPPSP